MSVQVQIVHQQWQDIKKVLRATQRKFERHQNLSLTNCGQNEQFKEYVPYSDNEIELNKNNQNHLLILRDTCRNTRRQFYMGQKRRELSFQNDHEFYSQLQSRRDQAQKQRILYSNVAAFEKAIKQIKTPKINQLIMNEQASTHNKTLKTNQILEESPYKSQARTQGNYKIIKTQKCNSFWSNVGSQQNKNNMTQILKQRFKKRNDLSLDISSFNYESLSMIKQSKTPSYF